jgi:hypothetical protein
MIDAAFAKAVLRAASFAGGEIRRLVESTFPGSKGNLARSFLPATFVQAKEGVIAAGAVSDEPHADIQDRGGTIYPRTVKMLAIPLTPYAEKRWPRDWPRDDLTIIRSKRGNLLLMDIRSKKLVPQYVLKDSVTIKGKQYISRAERAARPEVEAIAEEMAARQLESNK